MNVHNYGYIYNEIIFDTSLNIVIKRAKHQDGLKKLRKEFLFYRTINFDLVISPPFYIPKMFMDQSYNNDIDYNANINELKIEYFSEYEPFIYRFPYHNDMTSVYTIRDVLDHIKPLHNCMSLKVDIDEYKENIRIEIMDKVIERYNLTNWSEIYPEFEQIMYVNNLRVSPLIEYVHAINKRINYLIDMISVRENQCQYNGQVSHEITRYPIGTLTYIHGDIHLGNILVPKCKNKTEVNCNKQDTNNHLHKYIFIDPRGYFGKYDLYGEPRYDYAKLIFGISGYSIFDQMNIESIDISPVELCIDRTNKNVSLKQLYNINISFIDDYSHIFDTIRKPDYASIIPEIDEITILLSLSIWLGNNSTFTSREKKLTSLMIARYLCEKYIN